MDIQKNTEVEVLLEGGLGNQLFGWAAGYNLAKRTNSRLILNVSQLYQHGFQLGAFDLKPYSLTDREVKRKNFRNVFQAKSSKEFKESSFLYDSRIEKISGNVLLCGYFQSWKYSIETYDEIVQMLGTLKNPSEEFTKLSYQIRDKKFLGIHIRRGDYVNLENYHGLATPTYYSNSQELLERLSNYQGVAVFSDDISEAKKIIPNADLYVSSQEVSQPAENLVLMSRCTSLIGANSSFSLWAAMINKNPEGIFIFPRPWFSEKSIDTRDLLPTKFITLGNA
jgi:hypothetical protein